MSDPSPDFVRALRAGDPTAFATLVDAYTPAVRRLAMSYFRSPFDQEEAIQECFLLLFRQREAVDPVRVETLRGFVLTAARRRMIDILRSRRAEPPPEQVEELSSADLPTEEPGADEAVARSEARALLEAFEARLKPSFRPYFRAVFLEGKDFEQARVAAGLSHLRARYVKKVLLTRLRRYEPLLRFLDRRGGP